MDKTKIIESIKYQENKIAYHEQKLEYHKHRLEYYTKLIND